MTAVLVDAVVMAVLDVVCSQCCLIHPHGLYVVTGSLDTTVRVWEGRTGYVSLCRVSVCVRAPVVCPDVLMLA